MKFPGWIDKDLARETLQGHPIEEWCPRCGSPLLTNAAGEKWCSFVGGENTEPCVYYQRGLDLDEVEAKILNLPPIECPVEHDFLDGFYVRSLTMPAGAIVASKVHKTRHCFSISKGKVSVMIDGEVRVLEAPYAGITEAGTRRLLYILETCRWSTFHFNPTNERDLDKLEAAIIEPHENTKLGVVHRDLQLFHRIVHARIIHDRISKV